MSDHERRHEVGVASERKVRRATHRRVAVRLVMLAIGLSLLGVSCSRGRSEAGAPASHETRTTTRPPGGSTTSTTTTSEMTSATSPPTTRSAADTIIARYLGFWRARFAANRGVPNPNSRALREFATGVQLKMTIDETRSNFERGLAFRRAASPSDIDRVHVIELDGDHAVVQECVVVDGLIVRRSTGSLVDGDVATHNVRGELVRVDGVWTVSSTRLVQRWEGVAGCARASS